MSDDPMLDSQPNSDFQDPAGGPQQTGEPMFAFAAFINWMVALALVVLACRADPASSFRTVGLLLGVILIPVGSLFLVLPAMARIKSTGLQAFSDAMLEVNARWADLEAVRREHYKARMALESMAKDLVDQSGRMLAAQEDFQQEMENAHRHDQELDRHKQETAKLARQLAAWHEGAMIFVRAMERVIELPESELPAATAVAYRKCVDDFIRCVEPMGLSLILPRPGDDFDERVHRIEGEESSSSVAPGQVLKCVEWGIRLPDQLDRAKVILCKAPPAPATDAAYNNSTKSAS